VFGNSPDVLLGVFRNTKVHNGRGKRVPGILWIVGQCKEAGTIVPLQSIPGIQPDQTIVILEEVFNPVIRQPLLRSKLPYGRQISSLIGIQFGR
jgi:hypothetical protein